MRSRRPIFWRWRELDRVGGQLALVVVEKTAVKTDTRAMVLVGWRAGRRR